MKPIEILLVEDNPGDVRLTREAFREAKVESNLQVARDGVEALHYLAKAKESDDIPLPDLVLLDLNLPRKSGHDVLKTIKKDSKLRFIPVVVLTTSIAERDVAASYGNFANCYINKPLDFDHFIRIVQAIEEFWFKLVRLPKRRD